VAADTMPPLRLRILDDVSSHPDTPTADVVKRLQLPRKTVDRALQELHLLELLTLDTIDYGTSTRWIYSLAEDVDKAALEM
jgi:DNA-binding IclR family transcriptional regulator